MDTVTDFVNKTKGSIVDKFYVAGASKVSHCNLLVKCTVTLRDIVTMEIHH